MAKNKRKKKACKQFYMVNKRKEKSMQTALYGKIKKGEVNG